MNGKKDVEARLLVSTATVTIALLAEKIQSDLTSGMVEREMLKSMYSMVREICIQRDWPQVYTQEQINQMVK